MGGPGSPDGRMLDRALKACGTPGTVGEDLEDPVDLGPRSECEPDGRQSCSGGIIFESAPGEEDTGQASPSEQGKKRQRSPEGLSLHT